MELESMTWDLWNFMDLGSLDATSEMTLIARDPWYSSIAIGGKAEDVQFRSQYAQWPPHRSIAKSSIANLSKNPSYLECEFFLDNFFPRGSRHHPSPIDSFHPIDFHLVEQSPSKFQVATHFGLTYSWRHAGKGKCVNFGWYMWM